MFLTVTVTENGEPTLDEYVCDGVKSVKSVSVVPSPQFTVILLALPTTVVVNVTVSPAPPVVTSASNETDFTKALFLIFSTTSFKSSMASVTLVSVVNP